MTMKHSGQFQRAVCEMNSMTKARSWWVCGIVALALFATAVSLFVIFDDAARFYLGYHRLRVGMTLSDVELILGRGTEIPERFVPIEKPKGMGGPGTLVVHGDRFFEWRRGSLEIVVGFRDGRVIEKSYWGRNFSRVRGELALGVENGDAASFWGRAEKRTSLITVKSYNLASRNKGLTPAESGSTHNMNKSTTVARTGIVVGADLRRAVRPTPRRLSPSQWRSSPRRASKWWTQACTTSAWANAGPANTAANRSVRSAAASSTRRPGCPTKIARSAAGRGRARVAR